MPVPAQRTLSTIAAENGYRYRLTPTDVLWAARMAQFEGGYQEAPAVLWTMAQRAVLRWEDSFAKMLQEFSQPINPKWRRDGSFCRPGGQYHNAAECNDARLARRDRAANIGWRQLPSDITELVAAWATGHVVNPVPTAVDFAASRPVEGRDMSVSARFLQNNPGARQVLSYGGNVFISYAESRAWGDTFVGLDNRDGSITTTVVTPANALLSFARGVVTGSRVV